MNVAAWTLLLLGLVCITNPASSPSPGCGVPAISSRIVGGTDAVYGEWPWQVAVTNGNNLCGGSLINAQWVLSAAHCFNNSISPGSYKVSLGMSKLGESTASSVAVEGFRIHPNFTKPGDRGDIALVKLKNPVTFTNYIRPICLPDASVTFPSGMECWVTGWGTRLSGGNISYPNTLQEVMTPLIDYKQCDQMYHINSSISNSTTIIQEEKICSGYKEGGKDSCQGDSGGPLVCKVNGTWIQAGIVSWGEGCAFANRPGVYTLVPAYQSWIKKYIPEMAFSMFSAFNVSIPPPQALSALSASNVSIPPPQALSALSASNVSIPPPQTTVLPPAPVCGVPVVSSRIVGGANTQDGEWPWQIAVNYNGDFTCGGSLINKQWVLSAAHCFKYPSYPSYYKISLGMYRLGGSNPHGVTVNVKQIIKHSLYTDTGGRGDIALVKLVNPVNVTDYIQPICLPTESVTFPSGARCWVTGWGTRSSGENLPSLNTLQEVMTPLIDYKQCDQMYHIDSSTSSYTTIIQEEKICSGYKKGGKDSCQGDSGGPLVCKANGTWIQAGIVSWGQGCALPNRPGVYTLVPAYESWIKSYIPDQTFVSGVQFSGGPDLAWAPWKMILLSVFVFIHFV